MLEEIKQNEKLKEVKKFLLTVKKIIIILKRIRGI